MKRVILFTIILSILLVLSNCSRKPTATSQEKDFRIQPFTGEKIENGGEFTYIQTASWTMPDDNEPCAIRVRTTDGKLPEGTSTDEDGWILFGESIWTMEREISFTFSSEEGSLDHVVLEIDVQNRDGIILTRSIFEDRLLGTVIYCEQGNVQSMTTGTGLNFVFTEQTDLFVDGMYAHHFMYRVIKLDDEGGIIEVSDWHSSIHSTDIRRITLNGETEPALTADEEGCMTRVEAYVVTRSGITDEANPASIEFHAQEGMHPATMIYVHSTFGLGQHHFSSLIDDVRFHPELEIPQEEAEDGIHYATAFFRDREGVFSALWSEDFTLYLSVGFMGEYVEDNPRGEYQGIAYDEETNAFYYATIEYYDISFNGEALTRFGIDYPVVTDGDIGYSRVPADRYANFDIVLQDIPASELGSPHALIVRAVDNQGVPDTTPETMTFNLLEPVPHEEKSGILVVDGEVNSVTSPDDYVDPLYANTALQADLELDYQYLWDTFWDSQLHWAKDVLSPTDLDPYRLMVWHTDNPTAVQRFPREIDVLNIAVPQKLNMFFSGGRNIRDAYSYSCAEELGIFTHWLGIRETSDYAGIDDLHGNFVQYPWFIGAESQVDEYPDFTFDPEQLWSAVQPLLVPRGGMGAVAWFPEEYLTDGAEVIYRFVCKEPGTDEFSPSQEEYDRINGQPVMIRVIHDGFTTWLSGFPLSYMPVDQVTQLFDQIQTELQ